MSPSANREPTQRNVGIEALLVAGGHHYRLYHDPNAPARARTAIRQRLEELRTPAFQALTE